MVTTAIICIAIVVVCINIVLAILLYNVMLLLNEHNKRLLAFTKESLDNERDAKDSLLSLQQELNSVYSEQSEVKTDINLDDENETNYIDPDLT